MLIRRVNGRFDETVALQVDDRLDLGTKTFMRDEEWASSAFLSKPRSFLKNKELVFNGLIIIMDKTSTIFATQTDKITKITHPSSQLDFPNMPALDTYIYVWTRPDVFAVVQLFARGMDPAAPT